MVKREGMENLLLRYYEGETTEDETALVEKWLEASDAAARHAGKGRRPHCEPGLRPAFLPHGGGHGADFIQAGCKEGLGGCTS